MVFSLDSPYLSEKAARTKLTNLGFIYLEQTINVCDFVQKQ